MPCVHARSVVWFALDELVCCRDTRKAEDVHASRRRLTIGSQRWTARDHRIGERVHVRPMRLEQIAVIA
jgi:hypothetical protein